MYKSLQDLYAESCYGIGVPKLPRQSVMCFEGGVAGHMSHPFDLPSVRTGKDLIKFFEKAVKSLEKQQPAVKIDGINVSIKLVTNEDGSLEFGIDRGSNKPEDVKGVTVSDLQSRFPEGHGLIKIGEEVLTIFNRALPVIQDDLKKMGFFRKPLVLNMEYVQGSTNVIGYAENFLAIHGVNQIYEVKSPVRGSISRASKEVKYNVDTMENLIQKINKIAKNYGFKVYGSIPAELEGDISFDQELNTELAVKYTPDSAETKRLRVWLERCSNPRGTKVTLSDGKKVDALSKFIYQQVLSGAAMNELILNGDKNMINSCICGAVIYHTTRLLGQKILNSLTSPLGSLQEQEGIVIRDSTIASVPVKITGDFIIRGMESKFQAENEEESQSLQPSYLSNPNYMLAPAYSKIGGKLRVGAEEGY